jgi:hypothetical protein
MKPLNLSIACLALVGLGFSVVGCGDSGGPDPKKEEARLNSAVEMRKLFDKAGGDYAKLDATDKASFEKLAGGAGEAEKTWNTMKNGSGANLAGSGAGSSQ